MPSIERRFARFVGNSRVQVSKIWKQFLTQVLAYWKGKPVQLVLDCTPFDDRAIIVYLGLVVHSRVLPVAWRIMPAQEHWQQGQWELVGELMDEVSLHLEPTDCTLVADRGLAGSPLVKLCRDRRWHYRLARVQGTYLPSVDGRFASHPRVRSSTSSATKGSTGLGVFCEGSMSRRLRPG